MKSYKYIFFDLDHTLWDYENNSKLTLKKLYFEYDLASFIYSFDKFYDHFYHINNKLWEKYNRSEITQTDIRLLRFPAIFRKFNYYNNQLAEELSFQYMSRGPKEPGLIKGTFELLTYLSGKYKLSIITNGFEKTQHTKLDCSRIKPFFAHIITSEKSGFVKPDKRIFDYALQLNQAPSHETLMVGDNLHADISGAKNASIDTVFFNPSGISDNVGANYNVSELKQLRSFL